jgi:SAM-dependent methyltransferase
MTYLETAAQFYSQVAQTPEVGLCCVQSTPLQLPGLKIPLAMQEMNYGCGTTVHHNELNNEPTVLYVGVGGGLEALQFAYFSPRPGAIIAVEPVEAMREAAMRNLEIAATENPWFDTSFVEIRPGDAFNLPVADASVDIVAQNCLFNIFEPTDLTRALKEAYRVLKPGGRLQMSDPIVPRQGLARSNGRAVLTRSVHAGQGDAQRGRDDEIDHDGHNRRAHGLSPQQGHQQRHAHETGVGESRHQGPQRRIVPPNARVQTDGNAQSHDQQRAQQVGEKHPRIQQLRNGRVSTKPEQHARQSKKQDKPIQARNGLQGQKPPTCGHIAAQNQCKKRKSDAENFKHSPIVGANLVALSMG